MAIRFNEAHQSHQRRSFHFAFSLEKVATTTAALAGLAMMLGCGADTTDSGSPDGRDEAALASGRSDGTYGSCELDLLPVHLNDTAVSEQTLESAGVHARAASNIIEHRNGADGVAGTDDDRYFATANDVDDVYYVGRVAMKQLAKTVAPWCDKYPDKAPEVVFSPQQYHESHLARVAKLIDSAEHTLDIAMYSFRDEGIFDALEAALERGVEIRFVFHKANDDRSEPEGSMSARVEDLGINVRYINKIMHHKYIIVDGPRDELAAARRAVIASGSGNWSYSAGTKYDENTVFVYHDTEMALRFQQEFNLMWENSRDFVWRDDLPVFDNVDITDAMIPDFADVDAAFTSDNFKLMNSSRWGRGFKIGGGRNAVANRLVELIDSAEDSILIASGHLRSRPVSEALLHKSEEDPNVDIRIYLDGQEYISEWYQGEQTDDLESCLDDASTENQRTDCLDSGYYFSYEMQDAGIDIRFKFYSYRWHYTYAEQMHHKYLVIDGTTLVTGSYNLSDNAEHNTLENIMVFTGPEHHELVGAYTENFERIWTTGHEEERYDTLMDEIEAGSDEEIPIVFDSMALSWEQVSKLKSALYDHCADLNDEEFRRHPEDHFVCTRK